MKNRELYQLYSPWFSAVGKAASGAVKVWLWTKSGKKERPPPRNKTNKVKEDKNPLLMFSFIFTAEQQRREDSKNRVAHQASLSNLLL